MHYPIFFNTISDKERYIIHILRLIGMCMVVFISILLTSFMIYCAKRIINLLKPQWVLRAVSEQDISLSFKLCTNSTHSERNRLLKRLLFYSCLLGIIMMIHLTLTTLYVWYDSVIPFILFVIAWFLCEIIPCYVILWYVARENSYHSTLSLLSMLSYGTFV
jgi:hypothetical protein